MAYPLGILACCILPIAWERKQKKKKKKGQSMLVCTSLPPVYLGLSPCFLLSGAVPRAKILSYFFLVVAKVTLSGMRKTWCYWQCFEDKNQEDLVGDVRPADKGNVKRPGTLR